MRAAPHPKYHPLTIIAIAVAAVLVLGGGAFTAALFITQQQTGQFSQPGADARVAAASVSAPAPASAAATGPLARASASVEPSAEPSASAVVTAHAAKWKDINGTWCGSQGCITIVGLKNEGDSSSHYVHDRGKDARGCLWGYTGAGGVENTATVTYCPQGAPFVDPAADCGTAGDVTRERLYVRQYCVDPYYRG